VHQWRSIEDTILVAFSPERITDYNDNRPLGEALRVIPIEGSVVVSDEVHYRPSGGTVVSAKAERRNALFSNLFGHQMFSTWGRTWWHTADEKAHINRLMKLQEYHVGSNFNREEKGFSNKTKLVARQNGWTHFILKLEPDDERARREEDVPLEKLFSNAEWAVYRF
jgi:hypothetical protein